MDQKKTLLHLFVLLVCLSGLLSLGSFAPLRLQEAPVMEASDQVINREGRLVLEEFRRMDIESNDYPGSGANPRHDPKSPGRP